MATAPVESAPQSDRSKDQDSSSRDRHRERDKERDRDRDRERGKDKDRDRDKDKDRERDRHRDRDKDRKDKERHRSRSGSRPRHKRRPSRSRSPVRNGSQSRSRSRHRSRSTHDKEKERKVPPPVPTPQLQESVENGSDVKEDRADRTVFVFHLHPKVTGEDLYAFFSMVGQVDDIRLITDSRTKKSKGLAYIEFNSKDSVNKALSLNGQLVGGFPISITLTQAEKNKVAKSVAVESGLKLYIGSLHYDVQESDLRPLFEPFGAIETLEVNREPNGQSKGFGFVKYRNKSDAMEALQNLNGLAIAGRPMKVGLPDDKTLGGSTSISYAGMSYGDPMTSLDEMDEGGAGVAMTAQSRAQLMQKLSNRGASAQAPQVMMQPSTCVVVKNMFDPRTETEPDWDLDIKEDVEEEVEAKCGPLKHIYVDKENPTGHVYLRFHSVAVAQAVVNTFNGRYFASRQIAADFVPEPTYDIKFPKSK